tara:strand:- start:232 stop:432 length:201 start_codon:yes stop_codon:yes gene_type:complete
MIKKIINIIKNLFTPKREIDPHEVLYLHKEESDVPVYKDEKAVKKEHCDSHLRFRKSCKACQEIVA